MKLSTLTIILFAASIGYSFAQTDSERLEELGEIASGSGKHMYGKAMPPGGVVGTTLYDESWYQGEVQFYNGKALKNHELRYDVYADIVEAKINGNVALYKGENIKQFNWEDSSVNTAMKFINTKSYTISNTELIGFFEVLVDDEVALFAHQKIKIKEPDYVEGLDVGSRDYQIKMSENYYFAFGKKLMDVKQGKNFKELKNSIPPLKEFVKENNLSHKKKQDLVSMTRFLNSIKVSNVDL